MTKKKPEETTDIQESLARISTSLSVIAGIMDILLMELLKEKKSGGCPPEENTTPFSEENLRNKKKI